MYAAREAIRNAARYGRNGNTDATLHLRAGNIDGATEPVGNTFQSGRIFPAL